MTPYKPKAYDLPQNYQLDYPNIFKDLNILSKTDDNTDNLTNIPDTDVLNQEIKNTTTNVINNIFVANTTEV